MYKAQIRFQCSIPERTSHKSLCTQSDALVFQSYFPTPHSPLAFRLILSEAEIHNSSEEHYICSILRSLPVAGSALAKGKPHGASPSRFFPFLPQNYRRIIHFGEVAGKKVKQIPVLLLCWYEDLNFSPVFIQLVRKTKHKNPTKSIP